MLIASSSFLAAVRALSVAASLLLVACDGGSERPPSSSDGKAPLVAAPAGDGESGYRKICEPGASEICFMTVVNADGSVDCPESIRFCGEDGTTWHACGHFDVSADGQAVPPSDDTPAPNTNE